MATDHQAEIAASAAASQDLGPGGEEGLRYPWLFDTIFE